MDVIKEYISNTQQKKAIGAYLGLAIGDALGATVEFMSPEQIQKRFGVHNSIIGGGWLGLAPGQVTDDTEMSLVLGESILKYGKVTQSDVAQAFSLWMASNPVDIGNTVRRGIIHFRHSGVTHMQKNQNDAGNGACMRTLPVALATYGLTDENTICSASRAQAHVTHNNPLSDAATECVIGIIHAAIDGNSKLEIESEQIADLVKRYPEFSFYGENKAKPSPYIVETMQAVFQAFLATTTFESCLLDVVNRGGDADTTGAIAGMIAGSYYGMESIPKHWLDKLDASVADSCVSQAMALLAMDYDEQSYAENLLSV